MLSAINSERRYAERHMFNVILRVVYAVCRYADRRYTECRGTFVRTAALMKNIKKMMPQHCSLIF
jgi:hypothetical protein